MRKNEAYLVPKFSLTMMLRFVIIGHENQTRAHTQKYVPRENTKKIVRFTNCNFCPILYPTYESGR